MGEAKVQDYRCKHVVSAARWFDTEDNRRWFSYWFGTYDVVFSTRGSVIVLPEECGEANEGDWVMYSDGEFLVMEDEFFRETYEPEIPSTTASDHMPTLTLSSTECTTLQELLLYARDHPTEFKFDHLANRELFVKLGRGR